MIKALLIWRTKLQFLPVNLKIREQYFVCILGDLLSPSDKKFARSISETDTSDEFYWYLRLGSLLSP